MQNGFDHPLKAEASLPVSIPDWSANAQLCYQILSSLGSVLRRGTFRGSEIYISTRLLPKGERYTLRISVNDEVHHEGQFVTY